MIVIYLTYLVTLALVLSQRQVIYIEVKTGDNNNDQLLALLAIIMHKDRSFLSKS